MAVMDRLLPPLSVDKQASCSGRQTSGSSARTSSSRLQPLQHCQLRRGLLLGLGSALLLQPGQAWAQPAPLRSVESTVPSVLTIQNQRQGAVKVLWANYDGEAARRCGSGQASMSRAECLTVVVCALQESWSSSRCCRPEAPTQSIPGRCAKACLSRHAGGPAGATPCCVQTHPWRIVDAATDQTLEQLTAGAGQQLLTIRPVRLPCHLAADHHLFCVLPPENLRLRNQTSGTST